MDAPLISVVMNCFNGAAYLNEALESVCAQTFRDWELIFWDNQSTDRSADIFRGIRDPRFRYYRADVHTALGEARNRAVSRARGEWLAFLDCDDRWVSDKLELQLRGVEHPRRDVGLVYGPVQLAIDDPAGAPSALERYYRRQAVRPHGAKSIFEDLLERNFIIFSTLLLRRELYDRVGGINGRLTQNEDYDLLLKVSRLARAVCVDSPCAVYRIHAMNTSHAQVELNFKENIEIFGSFPPDKAIARARRINASRYAFYKLGRGEILAGLSLLVRQGSAAWALKRASERIFQRLSNGTRR